MRMRYAYYLLIFMVCAVGLGKPGTAEAQTGGIEGTVTAKQPDGSSKPAQGVLVDIHRLDIKGQYSTKTDKSGRFAHIGLPMGTYAFLLSGPGYNPFYEMNIRVTPGEPIRKNYDLLPGDGRRLTIDEVKKAAGSMQTPGPGVAAAPQISQEQLKKMQEEQLKTQAEQKQKAVADDEMIKHFNSGNQLATNSQYDEALGEYKLALEASPDHPSVFVVMGKMAESYFNQGVERNNSRQREGAIESFALAAENAKKAGDQATKPEDKPAYYALHARAMSVLARLEPTKPERVDAAVASYEQLASVQLGATDRLGSQNSIGDVYLNANRTNEAIAAFRKTLESDPDNLDAMRGLGFGLVQTADEGKYTEVIEVFTKFKNGASKDEKRAQQVAEADAIVAALKEALQPQQKKPEPSRRRP
ncbi:MAG: carboxypeptidase regulatory-like domain-containing protein [Acidobacteria bacterium]|nr:carboxypeptidase regulatory-like domain-containing protein [Acidobacteriota bacterium]